jgi:hypothetical protein
MLQENSDGSLLVTKRWFSRQGRRRLSSFIFLMTWETAKVRSGAQPGLGVKGRKKRAERILHFVGDGTCAIGFLLI